MKLNLELYDLSALRSLPGEALRLWRALKGGLLFPFPFNKHYISDQGFSDSAYQRHGFYYWLLHFVSSGLPAKL